MSDMDKYINNMVSEFERLSYEDAKNYSNVEKLLCLYAYYHYFNADSSKISDVIQGNVYEKDAADYISGIYIDRDSDNEDVDAVIVIYSENNSFDFPSILKMFKDAESAICAAQEHKSNVRKELGILLGDDEYKVSSATPLKIRLITNHNPKTVGNKRAITNALQAMKPEHDYVTYHISFGLDIEYEIMEIENPKEYVDEAVIKLDTSNNFVCFGAEESLVVNISALSLKSLYEQYGYRGLFAQNLRYYVKNAKVDENIIESIQEHPENFWYYNNGVIIICDDYIIDGDKILIQKFSIINGGQTTKLVGETDFTKDFYIQCKIIKNKYETEDERLEFISNVAEATNTQKPIKNKDLIANRIEQRLLKKQLADVGIYCQIKRGEKINKKLYPTAWQNTTNEELGQFLLSFVYQKPGTARGSKASICGNKERYSLLFEKKYNSRFLGDLLKIKAYYKLWINYIKKNDDGSDAYKIGLVNNGMFFMTAIIGAVCKIYYRPSIIEQITTSVLSDQKLEIIAQHDIDHPIFRSDIENKEQYFSLFEYCYVKFYRPGYEFLKTFKEKYNNYSNFTKINNNYMTYVFKQIEFEYRAGIPVSDMKLIDSVLYVASVEDKQRNEALLEKYVNVIYVDTAADSGIPENISSQIKEALVAYRTKTYKLKRIKAYEVFRNVSCDRIAKFAPCTLETLKALRCLDETQLTLYGHDIINIVKQFISK
ncbi:MAG: hypothetical protein HDT21_06015 [Ruminococcus sp.]|nr:hypothetical protein [Ruminococcus sp.]